MEDHITLFDKNKSEQTSKDKTREIRFSYGGFALIEFLLSEHKNITKKYSTALDIGSFEGYHTKLMRLFGIKVDQIDKYVKSAELQDDFNSYNFKKKKYDIIFCSHVVEHQRNIGFFLDKIYDLMHDHSVLIISGPKHPVERFVEGHINTCILPVFLQSLIYAGFDCKKGKMMQIGGIENSFIVKKAKNFSLSERNEAGYKWTDKHHSRSPYKMIPGFTVPSSGLILNNCDIWEFYTEMDDNDQIKKWLCGHLMIGLKFKIPKTYVLKGINLDLGLYGNFFLFNEKNKITADRSTNFVNFKL
ncbi:class I SAM-dependent methyltransferase [Alphaproteobacteria bacterium]|nr:class I SAM-dependent methyltransferase [Alphaproteobacteria bacterium]